MEKQATVPTMPDALSPLNQERVDVLKGHIRRLLLMINDCWKIITKEMGDKTPELFSELLTNSDSRDIRKSIHDINNMVALILKHFKELSEKTSMNDAEEYMRSELDGLGITYLKVEDFTQQATLLSDNKGGSSVNAQNLAILAPESSNLMRVEILTQHITRSLSLINEYWKIIWVEMGNQTPHHFSELPSNSGNENIDHSIEEINRDLVKDRVYFKELSEITPNGNANRYLKSELDRHGISYLRVADFLL